MTARGWRAAAIVYALIDVAIIVKNGTGYFALIALALNCLAAADILAAIDRRKNG